MRALVLEPQPVLRTDYPDPSPVAGETIVRVRLAGICGTDLELARGYMSYHGVPGHEFVGEVSETQSPVLTGRRVVGEINAACRRCAWCNAGLARHCPNRTVLGIAGRDGAFAEFLRLPDENLVPLPDSVPDELGVFVEPVAAIYEIFEQTKLKSEATLAVLGDGRLGALAALVLRAEGYAPLLVGHHREKLDRLASFGINVQLEDEVAPGFEAAIDCTGAASGLERALAIVRPRGTIILKSTAAGSAPINLAPAVINEVTIIGSRCGRFAPALAALACGKVDPRPLISKVFALDDAPAAFATAARSPNFKVLLKP